MKPIYLFFDGCCEPRNPGGNIGTGTIIKRGKGILAEISKFFPEHSANTNNAAEYMAMNIGLRWLAENDMMDLEIIVRGDSMLVINQMNRVWGASNTAGYFPYYEDAIGFRTLFPKIRFEWIPRLENHEADALSKRHITEVTDWSKKKKT